MSERGTNPNRPFGLEPERGTSRGILAQGTFGRRHAAVRSLKLRQPSGSPLPEIRDRNGEASNLVALAANVMRLGCDQDADP